MNEGTLGRTYKYKWEVRKGSKGKYGWRALVQSDTLNGLEEDMGELKDRIEKKIKQWEENPTKE